MSTRGSKGSNVTGHFAAETHGAITDIFEHFLGGDSALVQSERRLGLMPLNGKPINEHRARLRKPDRSMLHKQYHEGEMAAALLLGVGYSPDDVIDIEMADKPDLRIRFRDEDVYGEFTRVCHDADEQLDTMISDANYILKKHALTDAGIMAALKMFSPQISIRSRPSVPIAVVALVAEIESWIVGHSVDHQGGCIPIRFSGEYPTLASLGATYSCTSSPYHEGRNFVSRSLFSRDLQSLVERIQYCIDEKRSKGYPVRPLWLLMSVSESWSSPAPGEKSAIAEFFEEMKRSPLQFDTSGFDKVVVGINGYAITL